MFWKLRVLVLQADDRAQQRPACPCSAARRGRCSPIWMPGTLVAIGLNSPRTSAGAFGLRSNGVLVGQAARQVDHDDRLRRCVPDCCFGAEQLRQRQAAEGQAADLEEGAARQAVAVAVAGTEEGEHG